MSTLLLQLILCAVTIIQLTSSQATYDVTPQENDVTSCGSSGQIEQVLRQLVTVNSQLVNAVSRLQRDVAELKARDVKGKVKLQKSKPKLSSFCSKWWSILSKICDSTDRCG